MPTPVVVKLTALALLGLSLGPSAAAQDTPPRPDTPRPRAEDPRFFGGAHPGLAMLREAQRPKLGVMVESTAEGILVKEVQPDSLAAAAGVQADDLLLSLDGERLDRVEDIGRLLADVQPGAAFQLSVVRAGEGIVKLEGKRPEAKTPKAAPVDGNKGAFLGVELGDAADGGVQIKGVQPSTAAWFAGLEEGDVLTKVGDKSVAEPAEVAGAVAAHEPGELVALSWSRDGNTHQTNVRLGHRAPQAAIFGDGNMQGFVLPRGHAQGGAFQLPQGMPWRQHPGGNRFFFGGDDDQRIFQLSPDQLKSFDWESHFGADFPFGAQGGPHHGMIDIDELLEQHGVDLEELHDGARNLKIRIQDGRIEIDKDGEQQVIELGDDAPAPAEGAAHLRLSPRVLNVAPHTLNVTPRLLRSQAVTLPRVRAFSFGKPTISHILIRRGDDCCAPKPDDCAVATECESARDSDSDVDVDTDAADEAATVSPVSEADML